MSDRDDRASRDSNRPFDLVLAGVGHLLGVGLTFTALVLLILPFETALGIGHRLGQVPRLAADSVAAIAAVGAVAAFFWTVAAGIFKRVRAGRRPSGRVVRSAGGTVITEFLIVLPVFLLLTFGMAQLAINSIAGVLANVAAYESTRAVWIWEGWKGKSINGNNIDQKTVKTRAQIAAASVMTPVAPGEYISDPRVSGAKAQAGTALILQNVPLGSAAKQLINRVGQSAFQGSATKFSAGRFAQIIAAIAPGRRGTTNNLTMAQALDSSSFPIRTAKKWVHAIGVTHVKIKEKNGKIGAKLKYLHHQAMPVVGDLFGKKKSKIKQITRKLRQGNFGKINSKVKSSQIRGGYYVPIRRRYMLKKQKFSANGTPPAQAPQPGIPVGGNSPGVRSNPAVPSFPSF